MPGEWLPLEPGVKAPAILHDILKHADVVGSDHTGRTVLAFYVDDWTLDELAAFGAEAEDLEDEGAVADGAAWHAPRTRSGASGRAMGPLERWVDPARARYGVPLWGGALAALKRIAPLEHLAPQWRMPPEQRQILASLDREAKIAAAKAYRAGWRRGGIAKDIPPRSPHWWSRGSTRPRGRPVLLCRPSRATFYNWKAGRSLGRLRSGFPLAHAGREALARC